MNDVENHPSYLQLDRHCLGVRVDAGIVAHAKACARCAAYLASYRPADGLPAWLDGAPPLRARPPHTWRKIYPGAALLVAAAVLCLYFARPTSDSDFDGVKGAPAALVHVQRDGQASVWGGEPLAAGDKLRLEVMPEQFDYVSVFSLAPQVTPRLLYAGRVRPRVPTLLPKAWQLDAAPEPERLVVIFAHAVVSAQAAELLLRTRDPREVAIVRVNVPKRVGSN